jgi:hypothetical protein
MKREKQPFVRGYVVLGGSRGRSSSWEEDEEIGEGVIFESEHVSSLTKFLLLFFFLFLLCSISCCLQRLPSPVSCRRIL